MIDPLSYKGYNLVWQGSLPYYTIKNQGQGPVPNALRGLYTSKEVAIKAIDSLQRVKEKASDGKTVRRRSSK